MAGKQQGGTATLMPPKAHKPGVAEATIPVRILNAIGVAFNQNTRYAMSSLLVRSRVGEGKAKADQIEVVATDGRRMLIVKYDTDLFDKSALNMVIPGDVARSALKVAAKSDAAEPMATIKQNRNTFSLLVDTPSGKNQASWSTDGDTLPFPPFEDAIPDFTLYGVSSIGVSPDKMAKTLLVIEKIIGTDHNAKLFMPNTPDQPVGVEATDGSTIEVLGVVMPSNIAEWTKTDKDDENEDDEQHEMFEAWRGSPMSDLKLSAGLHDKLVDGGLVTVGQLADFLAAGKDLVTLEGVGRSAADKVADALTAFYKDRKVTPPAKPATEAEKARDEAQGALLEYVHQRFLSVGVPAAAHDDDKTGQAMDEAVMAMVFTPAQAKRVRETFEDPAVTLADVKAWHEKLKNLSDDDFRKAAKSAGIESKAMAAIKGGKKHTLPS